MRAGRMFAASHVFLGDTLRYVQIPAGGWQGYVQGRGEGG